MFDSNTRRITFTSLSDSKTNGKLLIPCFNAFIYIVIPGLFSAKPLQLLETGLSIQFQKQEVSRREIMKSLWFIWTTSLTEERTLPFDTFIMEGDHVSIQLNRAWSAAEWLSNTGLINTIIISYGERLIWIYILVSVTVNKVSKVSTKVINSFRSRAIIPHLTWRNVEKIAGSCMMIC